MIGENRLTNYQLSTESYYKVGIYEVDQAVGVGLPLVNSAVALR